MAWKKIPDRLVETFHDVIPDDSRSQLRKMFGCPCCFAGGNLFVGLHEETLFVRLPPRQREELLDTPGASLFEPLPGRKMREYVVVPKRLHTDTAALSEWVARGFAYALSLPLKQRKPKPPRRAKRATSAVVSSTKRKPKHRKMTANVKTKVAKRATGRKVKPTRTAIRKKK